ncbi:hypothetical protein J8273_6425 [Carpediemonas membranifera]|uniref:Uncharacterized protein n=1 Tax=Carpediemonas membranifera TaxID=201153 RepID=A0A8J6E8B3_9EUKA|nr:hypothetical protein J8273_6425 [Carpediemonas membranifera]|eukprot:KAG9391660.1 hypothetical protein J8273_6425 [Carpediemonas membranifera]
MGDSADYDALFPENAVYEPLVMPTPPVRHQMFTVEHCESIVDRMSIRPSMQAVQLLKRVGMISPEYCLPDVSESPRNEPPSPAVRSGHSNEQRERAPLGLGDAAVNQLLHSYTSFSDTKDLARTEGLPPPSFSHDPSYGPSDDSMPGSPASSSDSWHEMLQGPLTESMPRLMAQPGSLSLSDLTHTPAVRGSTPIRASGTNSRPWLSNTRSSPTRTTTQSERPFGSSGPQHFPPDAYVVDRTRPEPFNLFITNRGISTQEPPLPATRVRHSRHKIIPRSPRQMPDLSHRDPSNHWAGDSSIGTVIPALAASIVR